MNKHEFTYLINYPETIDDLKTRKLDAVLHEFPYFQTARAIQLNGLHKCDSYKYNQALKKTAAYTADRKVLFEFITSKKFSTNKQIEKRLEEKIHQDQSDKPIIISEESDEQKKEKEAIEVLEIGKPIQFVKAEHHSFNAWMQLITQNVIDRNEKPESQTKVANNIQDKFELIDKFIASNPKIKPADTFSVNKDIADHSYAENDSLMTETLAKVYIEQKKFENAIKAYDILSLKYPEKSGFFADQIKAIKILQKNKS